MRYIILLLLVASCAATNIMCMDKEKIDLRWPFAKAKHLQNANPQELQLIGISRELQTTERKAAIQAAFLKALDAVSLKQSSYRPDPCSPLVGIDIDTLTPLVAVVAQLQKEEAELKEKQRLEAIERSHNANITMLLEFNGIQSGFDYCKKHSLPTWQYLPAICLAIGE